MKCRSVILIAVITCIIAQPVCGSFKCMPPRSVKAEFNQATAVFLGEVIEEEERKLPKPVGQQKTERAQVYQFKVETWWKDGEQKSVEIYVLKWRLPDGRHVFGPEQVWFKKGERYLVYAFNDDTNLYAYGCTRTKNAKHAEEDLRILGTGQPPKSTD